MNINSTGFFTGYLLTYWIKYYFFIFSRITNKDKIYFLVLNVIYVINKFLF